MKLKHVLVSMVLLLTISGSNAQVINTDSLSPYPQSVVLKVFDVASKVPLAVNEQIALADLFSNEEQTLYNLIQNGADATAVDSAKLFYKYQFNSLLTAAELDAFYTARVWKDASRISRLTAAMLQQKYNTNGTLMQYFNRVLLARQQTIGKILLQYTDSAVLDANALTAILSYDSLTDQYLKAAAGTAYLNTKFNFLDSAAGVEEEQWSSLTNLYYNLCISNPDAAYADIFNTAFSQVYTDIADSDYYTALYNTEIMNNAVTAMQVTLQGYEQLNNLSKHVIRKLTPVVLQREKELAIINRIYPDYSIDKSTLIDTVVNTFEPVIDSLIATDGHLTNASQIDIAIKYRSNLGLSTDQHTQLLQSSSVLNRARTAFRTTDPAGEYDSRIFESNTLSGILTPEQYTNVLTLKFQSTASRMADQDWAEVMKHPDLSNAFDSVQTVGELSSYHLSFLINYYRNAHNKEFQYKSCNRINEIMPRPLVLLKNKWDYQSAFSNGNDSFLQW